jgi:hypothetical protein
MSPGPSRSAAALIASAVGTENAEALMTASGEIPVTPTLLTSPLISPSTAVPWLVERLSGIGSAVPATTPP